MYQYRATVTEDYDGDTFIVTLDLGFYHDVRKQHLRLAHVDAPEKKTAAGKAAIVWVTERMPVGTAIIINTVKPEGEKEKWGRWLAAVTLPDGSDLATVMIAAGHAVPYEGGPR